MTGVEFPTGARDFYLFQSVQIGFGAHPASNHIGTEVLPSGVRRTGYESEHSYPAVIEVKEGEVTPSPSHTSSGRVLN
jgi:hypothetical protein